MAAVFIPASDLLVLLSVRAQMLWPSQTSWSIGQGVRISMCPFYHLSQTITIRTYLEHRLSCVYSQPSNGFAWLGSWYASYAGLNETDTVKISCSELFSDVLYRPFQCAHTPLAPYTTKIPAANTIKRFHDLTVEEFTKKWTNTPFILIEPVRQWPLYQNWSETDLIEKYSDIVFRAESVDWPLTTYLTYMNNNSDESPLYLFDRAFVGKMNLDVGKNGDYWIPGCFGDDLFTVLDDQRPDSRWLIIGPTRSGSTFHKDPNATRYVFLLLTKHDLIKIVLGMLSFVVRNIGSCFQGIHHFLHLQVSLYLKTKAKSPVH